MNILITDDEEMILEILELTILDAFPNSNIFKAGNGVEAIGIEKNIKLDAVITDYKMPVADGLHLVEHIRDSGQDRNLPILFLSGFIPELKKIDTRWDNIFFLEKPANLEKIITFIKRVEKVKQKSN